MIVVTILGILAMSDSGGWLYDSGTDVAQGTVLVNCLHTDVRGSLWTLY